MVNVLRIHPDDNVVVALRELSKGSRLEAAEPIANEGILAQDAIPFGHKVAIADINQGQSVMKYGASIGVATEDIAPGQHVHLHNLRSVRGAASS